MNLTPVSFGLLLTTGLTVVATVVALRSRKTQAPSNAKRLAGLLASILALSLAMLAYDGLTSDAGWQPISSHVDGLMLVLALLTGGALYFLARPQLQPLARYSTPLLVLIAAWGFCAATWTYRPFESFTPVWQGVHLLSVFLGTTAAGIAAIAAAAYLTAQHRLRQRLPMEDKPATSLETLERVLVQSATLGFALLTAALITGTAMLLNEPDSLGQAWYTSVKLWLALGAWAVYALLMNTRYTARFRGTYAAWIAIFGLVLLISVYGLVTSVPESDAPLTQTQNEEAS